MDTVYRLFCAGNRCVNDVVGDIIIEIDGEEQDAPVCEFHRRAVEEDPINGLDLTA
jgi:hypothetical protein